MVRSAQVQPQQTPDPARILGVLLAIVVNFGLVVAMTLPPTDTSMESSPAVNTGNYLRMQVVPTPWGPTNWECLGHCRDRHLGRTFPANGSLEPIDTPAPIYPVDAARDGSVGTVKLELLVGTDGRVLDARVVQGSGDPRLDVAASGQLRNWLFRPAMKNGEPVQARARVPIVFTLDGQ